MKPSIGARGRQASQAGATEPCLQFTCLNVALEMATLVADVEVTDLEGPKACPTG